MAVSYRNAVGITFRLAEIDATRAAVASALVVKPSLYAGTLSVAKTMMTEKPSVTLWLTDDEPEQLLEAITIASKDAPPLRERLSRIGGLLYAACVTQSETRRTSIPSLDSRLE